jgi:hypothetical protein
VDAEAIRKEHLNHLEDGGSTFLRDVTTFNHHRPVPIAGNLRGVEVGKGIREKEAQGTGLVPVYGTRGQRKNVCFVFFCRSYFYLLTIGVEVIFT